MARIATPVARAQIDGFAGRLRRCQQSPICVDHDTHVEEVADDIDVAEFDDFGPLGEMADDLGNEIRLALARTRVVERSHDRDRQRSGEEPRQVLHRELADRVVRGGRQGRRLREQIGFAACVDGARARQQDTLATAAFARQRLEQRECAGEVDAIDGRGLRVAGKGDRREMDDVIRRCRANCGGNGCRVEEIRLDFVAIGARMLDEAEDAVAAFAQVRAKVSAGKPGGTRDQHAFRTRRHDPRG